MRKLIGLLAICATPALAEGEKPRSFSELYPPLPGVEYFCQDAQGTRFEIGQMICITASCQTWMARCDMSLNNPTWRKVQDGCPAANLGMMERLRALS